MHEKVKKVMVSRVPFIYSIIFATLYLLVLSGLGCNNPFDTREPQKPDPYSGAAIKPSTTPENVLYNIRASFEGLSIPDYLEIFSDDFSFSPHPDDSLLYIEDFRMGWGFDEETIFAENFLQKNVVSEIEVFPDIVEYKPGLDMYEYKYSMLIILADSTITIPTKVNGTAWIFFKESDDGKWKISRWIEYQNMVEDKFITWGVLRALYI